MNYFVQSLLTLTFFNTIIVLFVPFGNFINFIPPSFVVSVNRCLKKIIFHFLQSWKLILNYFHLSELLFYHFGYVITLNISFHSQLQISPPVSFRRNLFKADCYLHKRIHPLVLTHLRVSSHQLRVSIVYRCLAGIRLDNTFFEVWNDVQPIRASFHFRLSGCFSRRKFVDEWWKIPGNPPQTSPDRENQEIHSIRYFSRNKLVSLATFNTTSSSFLWQHHCSFPFQTSTKYECDVSPASSIIIISDDEEESGWVQLDAPLLQTHTTTECWPSNSTLVATSTSQPPVESLDDLTGGLNCRRNYPACHHPSPPSLPGGRPMTVEWDRRLRRQRLLVRVWWWRFRRQWWPYPPSNGHGDRVQMEDVQSVGDSEHRESRAGTPIPILPSTQESAVDFRPHSWPCT